MRGPNVLAHRAWDSMGNGALFTHRIRNSPVRGLIQPLATPKQRFTPSQWAGIQQQVRSLSTNRTPIRPTTALVKQSISASTPQHRVLQTSTSNSEAQKAQLAKEQGAVKSG